MQMQAAREHFTYNPEWILWSVTKPEWKPEGALLLFRHTEYSPWKNSKKLS